MVVKAYPTAAMCKFSTPTAVITGLGPVSVIGIGKDVFSTSLTERSRPNLGKVPDTDIDCYQISDPLPCPLPPHRLKRIDRTTKLALSAADLALKDAGLSTGNDRWSVSFGSALAGFSCGEKDHASFLNEGPSGIPLPFATRLIGASLPGHISIQYGITGSATANADSCAAGNRAIAEALYLIERGEADVVIAGAAEAPLSALTAHALKRLRVMSTTGSCRPFTEERDGFILAEGAAALVIESKSHARERGAHIYAHLSGSGSSAEAHHMTTPHPSALPVTQAMRKALESAGLSADQIDLINVHGSATPQNDSNEALAIQHIFSENCPAIYAAKSQLGHSLGAASALELVALCLALDNTCSLSQNGPALGLTPLAIKKPKAVLKNAFGFGGINSSLVLQAID